MDILACRVLNFKSHLNHTIWVLVNGKIMRKNLRPKTAFGRHVVKIRAPLSQRQNSLNEYFSRIDFAKTLQSGSLDQNNQTYPLIFSELVLLPVLWATSGLGLFLKYLVTQVTNHQSVG